MRPFNGGDQVPRAQGEQQGFVDARGPGTPPTKPARSDLPAPMTAPAALGPNRRPLQQSASLIIGSYLGSSNDEEDVPAGFQPGRLKNTDASSQASLPMSYLADSG